MIKVFFDGAFDASAKIMGIGCIIEHDGNIVEKHYKVKEGRTVQLNGAPFLVSTVSNNVSEYLSIIAGMEYLVEMGLEKTSGITFYGDSKLVIEQMSGRWGIKEGAYKTYAQYAKKLVWKFRSPIFTWIPREENTRCDSLSRKTL